MTDDDSLISEFEFRGDLTSTATVTNGDTLLSAEQQNILDDLRLQLCQEDLMYLNEHKEVEVLVNLILQEILEKKPSEVGAHVARFLRNPQTADRVADLVRSKNCSFPDPRYRDDFEYLAAAAAATISMNQQTDVVLDEHDETVTRDYQEF